MHTGFSKIGIGHHIGDPFTSYRLQRDEGGEDAITRRRFNSYDDAYDALEEYCSAFCCSDDDRIEYIIKANETTSKPSAE